MSIEEAIVSVIEAESFRNEKTKVMPKAVLRVIEMPLSPLIPQGDNDEVEEAKFMRWHQSVFDAMLKLVSTKDAE